MLHFQRPMSTSLFFTSGVSLTKVLRLPFTMELSVRDEIATACISENPHLDLAMTKNPGTKSVVTGHFQNDLIGQK
jgi:hypothetical protein